ncbi:WSC-domain-containing protein [Pholiota conissans]|uniref:WSC-domain-containing protein n=1 Tax=Pholiota conissans TaxID=109636 RepID=A0A9P5YPZ4_9AGAR|nr:WSC-domain-containing protein [Pholiota conissans]
MRSLTFLFNALCVLSLVVTARSQSWTSQGCFNDSATNHALTTSSLLNQPHFSLDQCIAFCGSHLYSGIENGKDCYCGDTIQGGSVRISDGACNVICTGVSDVYCGGLNAIQIFLQNFPPPVVWTSIGCYTDSTSSRTIRTASYTSVNNMTVASCQSYCATGGYLYAGVEYARECYCDNTIHSPGVPASPSGCNMPCTGDPSITCGGSDRIQIFQRS